MRTAEGVLLGHTRDRERLAGEARQQHVVIWHVVLMTLGDVRLEDVIRTVVEVRFVGLHRVGVPFAGKYATATKLLKGSADPADAGEKVDEAELAIARRRLAKGKQTLSDRVGDVGLGFGFPQLPAADRLRINSQCLGDLLGAEALEGEVDQFVRVHGCSGNSGGSMSNFFPWGDRKSTRLNSSHSQISYAVFCLKKKKLNTSRKLL